jgi:hypothetical protein
MTNMVPQASGNNQGPWANLENYLRSVVTAGNRLYIISGPAGTGGNSTTGSWNTITTPGGGSINVPAWTWKVALVLPVGDNDVSRVDNSTRTIAVIMPNNDNIRPDTWQKYLATVRQVESLSGYNFYSNVPTAIQDVIETKLDVTNDTAPVAISQTATSDEDNAVTFTLTATDFNINNVLSFSAATAPAHGALQFGMPACPASLTQAQCTVSVTYTPASNYNGPDSFTFKANDGALDSNAATVNITVNAVNDSPIANNQSVTTDSNTPVSITLTGSDVETAPANLVFATTSGTGNGALSGTAPNLVYTPTTNFCGSDNFRFTVTDTGDGSSGPLTSSEGTVSITVRDTIVPIITAPSNINTTAAPDADSAVVNFTVSASDSCGGVTVESTPASGSVFPLGVTTVQITATDDAGNVSTSSFTVTVKATSSVVVTCSSSETYTSLAIEPCTAIATGAGGLNQSVQVTYTDNVNVGTASANASFGGDATHESSSGGSTFTITKAESTTVVTCPANQTYTGALIEPCTASYSGVGGLSGTLTPTYLNNTNAGSAAASATYAGDANHEGSIGNAGFTIGKAASITEVTCAGIETYTGAAIEPCSAFVTGVGGLNQSVTPVVYADNVNVGSSSAAATYAGDANHNGSTGNGAFTINKASSTTTVNCPGSETYTGAVIEPCTATVTGAGGLNQTVTPVTYADNINAGSATARATFAGDANHDSSTGSSGFTIAKASSTTAVNCPASQTYSGAAIEPCSATVTGTGGLNQSVAVSYTSNTNVGTATANATFDGDANHAGSTGNATFTITKATPTITWSNPADIVYGTALSSTQLNANANVPGAFSYTPASGTVLNAGAAQPLLASFTPSDTTNYNATSKNVQINVLKATPSFSNLSPATIECHAATTNVSGTISFGSLVPTGSIAITVNGVSQNAVIQPNGSFSSNFNTSSLTPGSSPMNITFSYAGNSNFNAAIGSRMMTIADTAAPVIALNNLTLIFQGGLKVILNGNQLTVNGQTFTLPNGTINLFGHTITRNGASVTVDGQPFTINGQTILLATPNGDYQTVLISDMAAGASDSCDAGASIAGVTIAQASSDEPQNAAGNSDGNTVNDIVIAGDCKSVQLRVEPVATDEFTPSL